MQENKQEKSPIKQRILLFLAHKGVSPYEFYKNSGVTRGVLAQNNGISEENISRFLSYFPTVNVVWLMTGCGEMELSEQVPSPIQETADSELDNEQEISHTESAVIVKELVATIKQQAEEIGLLKERNAQLQHRNSELETELSRGWQSQTDSREFTPQYESQKV